MRDEEFRNIAIINGYLNLVIGRGAIGSDDPGLTIKQVMDNSITISGGPSKPEGLVCLDVNGDIQSGKTSFDPISDAANNSAGGSRKLRIELSLNSVILRAEFNIRAVAYSVNSETLDGKTKDQFIQTSTNLTQSRLESFIASLVSVNGSAAKWNGSNFVSYDPTDGSNLTNIPYSALTAVPSPLVQLGSLDCADGRILKKAGGVWSCAMESSIAVELDPSVAPFAKNSPSTGLLVSGANQLQVDVGTTANKIVQLGGDGKLPAVDASQLTNLPAVANFTGSLSGDVGGTQSATVVSRINGVPFSNPLAGDDQKFLKYVHGSGWQSSFIKLSELRNSTGISSAFNAVGCTSAQTLVWSSISDQLACQDIFIGNAQIANLDASKLTGTIAMDRIPVLDSSKIPSSVGTLNVVTKSGSAVLSGSENLVLVDSSTGEATITLPSAVGRTGVQITIKKIDSSTNGVIVDGNGTETLDGFESAVISQKNQLISLVSTGSNWVVIAGTVGYFSGAGTSVNPWIPLYSSYSSCQNMRSGVAKNPKNENWSGSSSVGQNGFYLISIGGNNIVVYCDMTTASSGWTLVLQSSSASSYVYTHSVWTANDSVDGQIPDPSLNVDAVSRAFYQLVGNETRVCLNRYSGGQSCETFSTSSSTARNLANGAPASSTAETGNLLTSNWRAITSGNVWGANVWHRWGWNTGSGSHGGTRIGFSSDIDSSDNQDSTIGIGMFMPNSSCAATFGSGYCAYNSAGAPSPLSSGQAGYIWIK